METPRTQVSLCNGYGSPPFMRRTKSLEEILQPIRMDADAKGLTTRMQDMQLEESPMQVRQPFQTPYRDSESQGHNRVRLPFQSFAYNRRPRQPDFYNSCLSSPPMNVQEGLSAEKLYPSHISNQQTRDRSSSFLVLNAPRLPASPDLDYLSTENDSSCEGHFLPPILSPLYKYSTVNTHALLRENISANDSAIASYMAAGSKTSRMHSHRDTSTQIPGTQTVPPPPSMPMIGSPTPPIDRKILKMRKGYDLALVSPLFSSPQSNANANI